MKKLILILIFFSGAIRAQWLPEVRLTNDPAFSSMSSSNARCVASIRNLVHVVWNDSRDGYNEIYYKRSTDVGLSWGNDIRLTFYTGNSIDPSISVWDSNVYIVWVDSRDGNANIYYKSSTNDGVNWGSDIRLSTGIMESQNPSITVSGLIIHVTWEDNRDGNWEIYYKRSSDGGISWGSDIRLTNNNAYSESPAIAGSGQVVYITWSDNRNNSYGIYYKRSTDGGVSWGADTRLTNQSSGSYHPTIALSGNDVHIVWYDYRSGNPELFYKHSTNGSNSWSADIQITSSPAYANESNVSVSGQNVHVVWIDLRSNGAMLFYKRSTNGGISWNAETQLTDGASLAVFSSMAVSDSAIHVVWADVRGGSWDIYYKENPTGYTNGNIGPEIPTNFSLSQNYPNPFNPITKFKIEIAKSSYTKVNVYDVLGREVATLVNQQLQQGTYEISWNASNYPSGVYFYQLTVNTASGISIISESNLNSVQLTLTKKMILIK